MIIRKYNKDKYTLESAMEDVKLSGYDIMATWETSNRIIFAISPKAYQGV